MKTANNHHIPSFQRREGRMTTLQKDALATLWPQYVINSWEIDNNRNKSNSNKSSSSSNNNSSSNKHQVILEIGFGTGSSLIKQAVNNPNKNFIGIEVYKTGIAKLLLAIKAHQLSNIKIFYGDAIHILQQQIPNNCINKVQLFFPDPWPKLKHHKRRIVNSQFLDLIHSKLSNNGLIHMATDCEDYATHMLQTLEQHQSFTNTALKGNTTAHNNSSPLKDQEKDKFIDGSLHRPTTKFELRGNRLGHNTWDLIFSKNTL